MSDDRSPVIVAFDGSPAAQQAVRTAADLLGHRRLLVVTVWEPGLAMASMAHPDATGVTYAAPTPEEVAIVDHAEREHAEAVAEAGARMARDLGVEAEALPVPDGGDVADTVAAVAEQHEAIAVVVGSRGLGGIRSKVLGSTSRRLLHDTRLPVLVVRAGE